MQVVGQLIRRVMTTANAAALAMLLGVAVAPRVVHAQSIEAPSSHRTSFGVLLGGTSSRVTDLNSGSTDLFNGTGSVANRYGYRGGLFVNRELAKRFSLQAEAYYIQKGTRMHANPEQDGSLDLSLAYVELPLMLRADLAPHSAFRPFVTAGPTMAFRVHCRGAFRIDIYTINATCRELNDDPAQDLFVSSDVGFTGGAGIEYVLMGRSVLLQLRYGRGLTTIVNNPSAGLSPKNSTFSLVTGIGFGR